MIANLRVSKIPDDPGQFAGDLRGKRDVKPLRPRPPVASVDLARREPGMVVEEVADVRRERRGFEIEDRARREDERHVLEKLHAVAGGRDFPPRVGAQHHAVELLHRQSAEKSSQDAHNGVSLYRSPSPSTMSTLPRMTTTSATGRPRHMSSRMVRLMKLGGRTWSSSS